MGIPRQLNVGTVLVEQANAAPRRKGLESQPRQHGGCTTATEVPKPCCAFNECAVEFSTSMACMRRSPVRLPIEF